VSGASKTCDKGARSRTAWQVLDRAAGKAPAARGGGPSVVAFAQRHRGGHLASLAYWACGAFLFQTLEYARFHRCVSCGVEHFRS